MDEVDNEKSTENQLNKIMNTQSCLRKDEVIERPTSLANNLIAQAPDKKDGYIKVKQIL